MIDKQHLHNSALVGYLLMTGETKSHHGWEQMKERPHSRIIRKKSTHSTRRTQSFASTNQAKSDEFVVNVFVEIEFKLLKDCGLQ